MTKEMLEEMMTICGTSVKCGNGWTTYTFTRTNANGVKFYYEATVYKFTNTIEVVRVSYTRKISGMTFRLY